MDVFTAVTGVIATFVTVASSHGDTCVQGAAVSQSRSDTTCRNILQPMHVSTNLAGAWSPGYMHARNNN